MKTWVVAGFTAVASVLATALILTQLADWWNKPTGRLQALVSYGEYHLPPDHKFETVPGGYVEALVSNRGTDTLSDVRIRINLERTHLAPAPGEAGEVVLGDMRPLAEKKVRLWTKSVPSAEQVREAVILTHRQGLGSIRLLTLLPEDYLRGNPTDRIFTALMFIVFSVVTMYQSYQSRNDRKWWMEEFKKKYTQPPA